MLTAIILYTINKYDALITFLETYLKSREITLITPAVKQLHSSTSNASRPRPTEGVRASSRGEHPEYSLIFRHVILQKP